MSRDRVRRPARDLNPRITRRRRPTDRIRRPARGATPRPPRATPNFRVYTRPAVRSLVLLAELAVLVALVKSPALAARQVSVTGIKHLTRQQVLARAGLGGAPSMLFVSSDQAEAELRANPYVHTASVRTTLPDRVDVELSEWEPLVVVSRAGAFYVLNERGTVLGVVDSTKTGGPGQAHVAVSWDAPGPFRVGQSVLPGLLVQDLASMHAQFPAAFGFSITGFSLDSNQKLTANTTAGPRIFFGQMATDEQIASLDAKLASLKSLRARVDLANSKLDYIDLENPAAVTTRAIPSPSPSPSPTKRP